MGSRTLTYKVTLKVTVEWEEGTPSRDNLAEELPGALEHELDDLTFDLEVAASKEDREDVLCNVTLDAVVNDE